MVATWGGGGGGGCCSSFELSGNYTSEINFGFPYRYTYSPYAETYASFNLLLDRSTSYGNLEKSRDTNDFKPILFRNGNEIFYP